MTHGHERTSDANSRDRLLRIAEDTVDEAHARLAEDVENPLLGQSLVGNDAFWAGLTVEEKRESIEARADALETVVEYVRQAVDSGDTPDELADVEAFTPERLDDLVGAIEDVKSEVAALDVVNGDDGDLGRLASGVARRHAALGRTKQSVGRVQSLVGSERGSSRGTDPEPTNHDLSLVEDSDGTRWVTGDLLLRERTHRQARRRERDRREAAANEMREYAHRLARYLMQQRDRLPPLETRDPETDERLLQSSGPRPTRPKPPWQGRTLAEERAGDRR